MTDNEIERILGEADIRREERENTYMDYLIEVTEWEWWIDKYVTLKLDEKGKVIRGF